MWASVMLFMLALLGGFVVAAVAALSLYRGRKQFATRLIRLMGAGMLLYVSTLVAVALLSDQKVIALGGEKHFCEIDCHVAYTVEGVRTADSIGGVRPQGVFYIVDLRTRFDPETVSDERALGRPLRPGPRKIRLISEPVGEVEVSVEGQRALNGQVPGAHMLTRPLVPGEEFRTQLVFDVPRSVTDPMLLVQDSDFTKWVLIGSETFPLHKKAVFRLTRGPGLKGIAV